MPSLIEFYEHHRAAMVKYATRVLVGRGISRDRAFDLAEDVVQTATLFFVGRAWDERLFVGKVRYVALRAGQIDQHVFLVRNTCDEGVGHRGARLRQRRARVTNVFPVQIFGKLLDVA